MSAPINILAISGSLRSASSNTALLRALKALAPSGINFCIYEGIGGLPHFNPEQETDAPLEVIDYQRALKACDGLVICTPEYAHGMPGVLKNALDWVVGSGELVHKAVMAISASPSQEGGSRALSWLTSTLTVMTADLISQFPLPHIRQHLQGDVPDEVTAQKLREELNAFVKVIASRLE